MKIALQSTERIVKVSPRGGREAIEARVWEGYTEEGTAVYALIAEVAVHENSDQSLFTAELLAKPHAPSTAEGPWPLRYFIG